MNNLKLYALPILERRKNEVRDAKISLVAEHAPRDESIQNEIRKRYSLSEEIALLRKEVNELRNAMAELLQLEPLSEKEKEFTDYHRYVEKCKSSIKEEK